MIEPHRKYERIKTNNSWFRAWIERFSTWDDFAAKSEQYSGGKTNGRPI